MPRFEFAAPRIVFGEGVAAEAAAAAAGFADRALWVTGGVERLPTPAGAVRFAVRGEPTLQVVRDGAAIGREAGCGVVVAVGGGSAIDAGKAIAAMISNPGDPLDYLEVVGRGLPLTAAPVPFLAVPATAGTGSEVTRNAVLGVPEHRVKASLRSPRMLARIAFVDPDASLGLPPSLTASTGLDALTQLIEAYVSIRANPMTDALCVEGLRAAAPALRRAYRNGSDREARGAMAWAACLSGLALSNAALGAVHGFAAPIGGAFAAPHGAVCAALLPHVMRANGAALRSRMPESPALARYDEIARLLTGAPHAVAADGERWVTDLVSECQIPGLSAYGVAAGNSAMLVDAASKASSMKGNPVVLEPAELAAVLRLAMAR